jgi:cysteine desulfurase
LKLPLYFDAHATTPCDPRVVEVMLPFFTDIFGNAASRQHPFGWAAREATDAARGQIAKLIGAKPKDIIFTSGATESNNLAIKGLAEGTTKRHIVTVETEHRAVLDPCDWLEKSPRGSESGCQVTRLRVKADGLIDVDELRAALRDDTILVSVMAANNEIGVLQPLRAIGELTSARGIAFHTDAAQAAGKVPLDVEAMRIDLLSLTAHKMYGPKGIGALFVRRRGPAAALLPQIHGGGHERGLRSGTLNTPAIVGFGAAAEIAQREMPTESQRLATLRDRLREALQTNLQDVTVNGSETARLPHNLNVSFAGVDGATLLMSLTDIALSSGAACSSASAEPSHVLKAIGVPDNLAKASLRFGLSRFTTIEEVDHVVGRVSEVVTGLRGRRAATMGS